MCSSDSHAPKLRLHYVPGQGQGNCMRRKNRPCTTHHWLTTGYFPHRASTYNAGSKACTKAGAPHHVCYPSPDSRSPATDQTKPCTCRPTRPAILPTAANLQKPNRPALSKPSVPTVVGQPHLVQLIQLGLHEVVVACLPGVLIPAQSMPGLKYMYFFGVLISGWYLRKACETSSSRAWDSSQNNPPVHRNMLCPALLS